MYIVGRGESFQLSAGNNYRQVSNLRRTLVGNNIFDHSNAVYIFILDLTPGFIGLGKDNCTTRRETFKFGDLMRLILQILLCMLLLLWTPNYAHSIKPHDGVIKWEYFPRYWPFVRGIHHSPHKGQWRGALMFSLICVWINGWVNNREAGNWRRHRAHYDVIVIQLTVLFNHCQFFMGACYLLTCVFHVTA